MGVDSFWAWPNQVASFTRHSVGGVSLRSCRDIFRGVSGIEAHPLGEEKEKQQRGLFGQGKAELGMELGPALSLCHCIINIIKYHTEGCGEHPLCYWTSKALTLKAKHSQRGVSRGLDSPANAGLTEGPGVE